MNNNTTVTCNDCNYDFTPEIQETKDGDLELSFFRCPSCGKRYLISVTDEELRAALSEYAALSYNNRVSRLCEKLQKQMQDMKEHNLKRSEELEQRYMKRIKGVW